MSCRPECSTCEGLRHRTEPVISIQYHSEASPGPQDNLYVFDRFLEMIGEFQPATDRVMYTERIKK